MTARRRSPPGLRLRGSTWTFEVRHKRLRGGRMVISLRTEDVTVAMERMAAIRSLMDRGDWKLIDRLRTGGLHITDIVRGIREGDVAKLRRAGHDPTLLGDAVDAWLQTVAATKSDRTYGAYRTAANLVLREFGRDYPMEDMTRARAEAWLHEDKKTTGGKPWSKRRQNWMAAVIGSLWARAIETEAERADRLGYTPSFTRNPWRAADTPKIEQTRVVFLAPAEWRRLEESLRGHPQAALLALAYLAGLRAEEILYLRTGVDVELGEDPVVRVQGRAGEHPWTPKTDRSERVVPVSEELHRILLAHVEAGYAGDRYLIRLPDKDEPVSSETARRWTRLSYEAVGIKYGREGDGLTLHSGRHTFASWLAQRGVPLNIVADLLGDTMQVVYQTYAHMVPNTLREAVQVIDRAVRDGTEG